MWTPFVMCVQKKNGPSSLNFTAESQMTPAVRVKLEPLAFQHCGRRPPGLASASDFIGSEFLRCRVLSRFGFVTLLLTRVAKSRETGLALPGKLHHLSLQIHVQHRLHKLYLALCLWPPAAEVLSSSTSLTPPCGIREESSELSAKKDSLFSF